MKKCMMATVLCAALSAACAEEVVRFIGSDGYGKAGPLHDPNCWEGGQFPGGRKTGLISDALNVWVGQPLGAVSIRQTGGLVKGPNGLALRGGAAGSGNGALYEIDDPNTNYTDYVSLDVAKGNPLVLWSQFGEPVRLRLLSGRIETGELSLNAIGKGEIDIRDGIFHAGKMVMAQGKINMLTAGSGSLVIDELACNLNQCFINFETGNRGQIVLGQKAGGASAGGTWQWMISNRRVSIDGKIVTDPGLFEVGTTGTSTTLRLAQLNIIG